MAVDAEKIEVEKKTWALCKVPFWNSGNASASASTSASTASFLPQMREYTVTKSNQPGERSTEAPQSSNAVAAVAKSLLPTRRRLRLDPPNKLYFPYEPGKQVRSAIEIKNVCKSHVAFKFQTTAPKSCYMRPPGGVLAPGESIIASVFKFVEPPENEEKPEHQKSKVKFKIMSLKLKHPTEYVPEMFDEQRDQAAVEQILRVVFLDPEQTSPFLEKLRRQLAECDAALETRKKPVEEEAGPEVGGGGLVIDEWKERRERYLARQQVEAVDAV